MPQIGYHTCYKNARFGRIECHEAICAWGREILHALESLLPLGWDEARLRERFTRTQEPTLRAFG